MTLLTILFALQQAGIASQYPGDEGIERDPRVLFTENFETGDIKSIGARWGDCGKPQNLRLVEDVAAGSPGRRALKVAFGGLYTHFKGADRVYARYSIKFDAKCGYTHHLPFLLADGEPTTWPKGFAGKKPGGDNFFGSALDAWGDWGTLAPPGKWMLYSYWQEMKPDGRGDYWGNNFKAAQDPIERGRWYTVEMMIKANSTPEAADGEQAFWVDGKLIAEFKGFRWRSTDKLKLNSFWLLHDGHTEDLNKDADHASRVYEVSFDDVVLATEYIGPVQPKSKGAAPAGIAAQYPGDEGIEKDPRVLFVEDFESGDLKEIGARWGEISHAENMDLSADVPADSPGVRSVHIAKNGHLYTHTKGVDTMFARFYVKFHPKTGYIHHFVHLNADRAPTPWPKGAAGLKPAGDQAFTSGIEPWGQWGKAPAPGVWHFYSYWHEMKGGNDGKFWGNFFDPPQQEAIQPGRWYCIEAMLKANSTPETSDGEQTFWVDGKKVGEFKGIRWRTTDQLKVNTFWLLYYITEQSARHNNDTTPDRVYEIWFDDIVLATEYIGPLQGRPKSGKRVATPGRSALHAGPTAAPKAGKLIFAENFENGAGKFKGGEVSDGALSIPPKGTETWGAWSTTVGESTTVKFRLKPLVDLEQVSLLIWSDKLKDNTRYYVTGLKKGEWKTVEFRGVELRTGWALDGPSLDGSVMNNLRIVFEGPPEARVLLDDFEVRE